MAPRALSIVDSTSDRKCVLLIIDNTEIETFHDMIAAKQFRHTEMSTSEVQEANQWLDFKTKLLVQFWREFL